MGSTMNGAVIYKSRYGATQQYADWMGKACKLPVLIPERIDGQILAACDFLVLGTPVYTGELLIKDWINDYRMILQNKELYLFVVCGSAMSNPLEQHQILRTNLPKNFIPPGNIFFLPGRLNIEDLTLTLPLPRLHEICHIITGSRS